MTTTDIHPVPFALTLALTPNMTYEQEMKEMYAKTAGRSHSSKMTMEVMIEITMAFESVCATARVTVKLESG
jgi:hypothetical protein